MRSSRWTVALYAAILLIGAVTALPNLLTTSQLAALPGWLPKSQVTLGLDLRGGSHLVLEVDAEALKRERLQGLLDDSRSALRSAGIAVRTMRVADGAVAITLADAGDRDRALPALRRLAAPVGGGVGGGAAGPAAELEAQADGDGIRVTLTEAGIRDRVDAAVVQSLEVVRRRVDQVGVAEPTIQRIGADRILVQLPGLQDPARLRALLGSTAKLSFHLLADSGGTALPRGVSRLPAADGTTAYGVVDRVAVAGDRLTDARAGFDQRTGEPIVSFKFDGVGARQFGDVTRQNVGRPFAIVLDGKVLSAPVIREPITGGAGQISGSFTVAESVTLSAMLRAGALPAPLTVIEERSVGPDLGSDAIRMGIETGIAGLGLVMALMLALYGPWGMIANLALGLNIVLTLGALSALGATLTLPGIAGIVLGIGLAVDANILINERIREETRRGAGAFKALDLGFSRAYSTIVDANVTTLLATGLLFLFGSGPARGFAVTMMLGIVISMFTAVAVVRLAMTEIVRRQRPKTLRLERLVRFAEGGTTIRFMRARFLGIGLSIFLSLVSVVLFIHPGLSYGIDFKGGIQIEAQGSKPVDMAGLRTGLEGLGLGQVSLQGVGTQRGDGDRGVLIRLERQPGGEAAQTAAVNAARQVLAEIDPGASVERTEVVGPKISGELAEAAILAVGLAALAMLGYIWWRFEWHFAAGAIATLVLDTTKTIGFFALTGIDFDLAAIAALLTIIGYSVNDKVVLYDRMRENLRLYKAMPFRELIDLSINQVLARCIFTSLTTFLAILPMAAWGGSAVASFAIPMAFGVVVATSSSIFIAAPILLFLGDWWERKRTVGGVEADPAPAP